MNIPTPVVKTAKYVGPSGGFNAAGMVFAAGAIAFIGTWRDASLTDSQIRAASLRIIVSTIILMILASIADNTPLEEPVKWLGITMVLVALLRYVPKFSTKAKAKKNG